MLMADDGPNDCQMEAFAWEDLDNENLCMDLDQLFHMLDESPESAQSSPEEHPVNGVMQGSPNLAGSVLATCDVSTSTAVSPSLNFETSAMTGVSHASYVGATNGFCASDGMTDGFCDRAALSNNICVSFGNSNGVKLETLLKSDSPVPGFCGRLGEWMSVEDPCHFNVGTENISCHDSYTGGALDCKGTGTGTVRRHFNDMFSLATSIFDGSTAKTDASSFDCTNVKTESHINFIGRDVFTEGVTDFTGIFAMEPNFTLPNDSTSMHSTFFPPSGQFPDSTLAFRVPYGSDSKRANLSNDEMKVFNEDSRIGSGVPLVCGVDSYRLDHRLSKFVQSQDVFAEEQKFAVHESKRPHVGPQNYVGSPYGMSFLASECLQNEQKVESSFLLPSNISKEQVRNIGLERCLKTNKIPNSVRDDVSSRFSKISRQKAEKNPSAHTLYCNDDDDADICILENISAPAPHPTVSLTNSKSLVTSQRTLICDSFDSPIVGPMSVVPKAKDERSIFKAALQDLCQPRSEDALPDGVLAVPLLRHQRIALSWMVKKERDVSRCSGGILADDQGLGKTISTIALILKEKAPITVESITSIEPETFNLDEDDCAASNSEKLGEDAVDGKDNGIIQRFKSPFQAKRKPAAGTLVVCPTSVLRQWSDELQNKVTPEAGLSVLVYHGANRTKDPFELSKFDVVLTTYSIVSMEVPKQPMVDEDDDDTKGVSDSPMKFSCSKKRKYPPTGSKKSLRGQKALEETLSRPLASVRWFRVVLDEAQSIKNHRTQVARACWGLRAKRRWCLSGTPIQNAVDDLYSYFRFLRYDPYSKYQSFCSALKGPIHRSPASGYKKLQAVLKTIMLRRTKGTFLDGEPIICLPPKIIELKQVDFTEEERDFYNRLEADSRAQFAEYEAAGTVKQNYVNILLMLLRLRQACDHPLLVRSSCSNSMDRSSLEVAKKLSQEKQINLMKCLEDSLAICGICSDPPEEAVVTSCGHVFCNQCVCDLVTGEDTHCPTSKCQATLRTSHIFSSATLTSCLSDQSCAENTCDSSPSKPSNKPDPPCSSRGTYASSKIKAALQVLQSLIKQPNYSVNPQSIESHSHDDYKQGCEINETNKVSAELASSKVGEKALIFSQWTRMLDLLEACLKKSSIQYRRLDGTMSVAARDKAVKDFNSLPEVTVLIMSLKAASLGLNLVAASHVMLLDLWWNPTTEDQAIDRAHRIGQTRPVTVLRLTVKNTVEDRILALQQKKRKMVASAFGEDEKGCSRTRLTEEDLQYLFADR